MKTTLSILQYRDIIDTINTTYGINLKQHAMTSLRQHLLTVMDKSKYSNPLLVVKGIKEDKLFFEQILSCLYCEHISLFRDPAMWRILKTHVIDLLPNNVQLKVWIPEVSQASDYYSLLIMLKKLGILSKSKIVITDESSINLEKCRQGELDSNIINSSESNIKRLDASEDLYNYINQSGRKFYIDRKFLKTTYIQKGGVLDVSLPFKPNLVLFRNRMIYFNQVKEQKVINQVHKQMVGGGFLITGVKEDISAFEIRGKFRLHNQEEQIYKRNF